MAIDELLTEIEKNQKVIAEANRNIVSLTKQLRESPFEDYDMIPVKTAAEKVGMSVCWVYGKINNGELKATRKGAKLMVSASEVMAINDTEI